MARLTVTVSFAWWLTPYLYGVVIVALLTGAEPDYEKVNRKVMRALRIRFI